MTSRRSLPTSLRQTSPVEGQKAVVFAGHDTIVAAAAPVTGHVGILSEGPDSILGTAAGDSIDGAGGNDTIIGYGGNDSLNGDDGNDTLYGGTGFNNLQGKAGDDWISLGSEGGFGIGGTGSDTVYGGVSNDELYTEGLEGPDAAGTLNYLYGGAGFDTLEGGAGNDRLYGQDDDDRINGYAGDDLIDGGNGNDVINAGLGSDTLYGGAGNDTMSGVGSFGVIDTNYLYGGAGNDSLRASFESIGYLDGGADADYLEGGDKADTLIGGTGVDTLEGLVGNDNYFVDNTSDVVIEAVDGGIDLVQSTASVYTLAANVENLRLLSAVNCNGIGNGLDNVIYAGDGNNVINGGGGSDTVSYAFATSGVIVTLALVTAQETGGSGTDTLAAIEALFGSNFDDQLTGNNFANTLSGGAGNDLLNGAGGADRLVGGAGNDNYFVDNAGDVVTETAANGNDTVASTLAAYTLGANVENLVVSSTGAANGTGNSLNNAIYAGSGNNVLNGGGTDVVSYFDSFAGVTVSLALTTAQATGGSGTDTLLNFENLTGSQYADQLWGSGIGNFIDAAGGDDRIYAAGGADTLVGGAGADDFVYDSTSHSGGVAIDTIVDFSHADGDRIDLSGIDANGTGPGLAAFTYIGDAAFSADATGQLRYVDGVLFGSTDADADAEFAIILSGAPALVAGDFVL